MDVQFDRHPHSVQAAGRSRGEGTALPPAIAVEHLTKRFGRHVAVDDLTFAIPQGVVTGFLGPNGSGKTTTMRMVLGLAHATSGTASVMGQPFSDLRDPGRHVGVVIDGAAGHPRRTARDHLRVLAAERRVPEHRIDAVLADVELTAAADRRVREFSLGMRQRLQLAAALLGEPQLLLLDEPANGLDPAGIRWLRTFLRGFAATGGTVFVSSHQLGEISLLADEVVVINHGRLIAHTTVTQLVAGHVVRVRSPQAEVIRSALQADGADVRPLDETTFDVADVPAERIGELAAMAGAVLHELAPRSSTLEDVFLELTTQKGATS